MCGIAGRINYLSERPVSASLVGAMTNMLGHRGPDGSDVWVNGFAGLGHRRLAVIDLSPAGAQPMSTADGELWLTFNGEIYNFLELKHELEGRGHRFRSHTDSEVILYAYREFGVDCLQRLRGMFAFASWDAPRRRLFAARDRLGKKPLVYWTDRDGLAFASEPKAFLADPSFAPEPDAAALSAYLTYQYVPAPLSAFAGVKKLAPAHYLLVEDGRLTTARYWKLRYQPKREIGEREAIEEVRSRLREAVKLRLISDVPLGAFLSGGIDSGSIVALMAELGSGPVNTFSIGFEEKEHDELPAARLVAERYGTRHREFIVRPDAVQIIPKLVWHYNEPFADSSAIPTFMLSELTRRHVTVALNGDGGDESFAGYERYRLNMLAHRYDRIPLGLRRRVGRLASVVPVPGGPRALPARGKRFLQTLGDTRERRYVRWISHFDTALKSELCTPEFLHAGGPDPSAMQLETYAVSDAPDFIDATLDVDVNHYLPDDLLVKVDIATMAYGLEARSPFLDHPLVEFAATLPSRLKLRGAHKKYILKEAVKPLLPQAIIDRPKMGFGVPLAAWFRNELKELAGDVLASESLRARGYFRPPVVRRLLDEHFRGARSWHPQLWNLLMLELWHRAFVDRRPNEYSSIRDSLATVVRV
jgi:asparagine synthase (glutamine-hydrolysing)